MFHQSNRHIIFKKKISKKIFLELFSIFQVLFLDYMYYYRPTSKKMLVLIVFNFSGQDIINHSDTVKI